MIHGVQISGEIEGTRVVVALLSVDQAGTPAFVHNG